MLETPRLMLRFPTESDGELLKEFEARNQEHLFLWRSVPIDLTIDYEALLKNWKEEVQSGKSVRFFIFSKEDKEQHIIGRCNFTQIFRGPFQACYLGYEIDKAYEGKGLMQEGIQRAIDYIFQEQNLHRMMANYIPSNQRSAKLLEKLGFKVEGKAEKYLMVNGKWEDHILTSLTNTHWRS